jgi:hypothetical protein
MPILGFSGWWTGKETIREQKDAVFEFIQTGKKNQTIRKPRKYPIKPGDLLYLYWHMRQKDCTRIALANCTEIIEAYIDPEIEGIYLKDDTGKFNELTDWDLEQFILRDGFNSQTLFFASFRRGYYDVIRWRIQHAEREL